MRVYVQAKIKLSWSIENQNIAAFLSNFPSWLRTPQWRSCLLVITLHLYLLHLNNSLLCYTAWLTPEWRIPWPRLRKIATILILIISNIYPSLYNGGKPLIRTWNQTSASNLLSRPLANQQQKKNPRNKFTRTQYRGSPMKKKTSYKTTIKINTWKPKHHQHHDNNKNKGKLNQKATTKTKTTNKTA